MVKVQKTTEIDVLDVYTLEQVYKRLGQYKMKQSGERMNVLNDFQWQLGYMLSEARRQERECER